MDKHVQLLIVEDEFIIASSIQRMVESIPGLQGSIVSNGQGALDFMRTRGADIVLMDIGLPGSMNGLKTALRIRSLSGAPILFMSGYSDEETRRQVAEISNSIFVNKPVSQLDLRAQLEKLIEGLGNSSGPLLL